MNFDRILIDSSSIINLFRYYYRYYDSTKDNKIIFKNIFEGLKDFLVKKIKEVGIIVLDKVFDELRSRDIQEFKDEIKKNLTPSISFVSEVGSLIEKQYILENTKIYNDNSTQIAAEIEKYETTYADLYLVACGKDFKLKGKKVLLVTEENIRKDNKLIEKLPTICKKMNEEIGRAHV